MASSSGLESNISAASSTVPAFVAKLWSLVDDDATNELISWGADGRSFHLFDHFRFAKEILPLFFKHSNLSSFIRQLNMYGFRKVLNIEQGGLKVERDDMEFQHHFFIQGQPEMLPHIKRKITQTNATSHPGNSTQVALMQQDALIDRANMEEKVDNLEMSLKVLQATQDVVNEQLVQIKRENGTLWQELSLQRQKHLKQQQITHKLLQFIMHSVLPSSSSSASTSGRQRGSLSLGKRKFPPLMIDQPPKRATTSDGLTHSASIDSALEAIEDVFAASPDVQPTSGPIIREIPLEVYEASVRAAASSPSSSSAAASSSNGQSSIRSTSQHVPNVSSTVTQPTFATAVAEDGSTVLLVQTGNGANLHAGNGTTLASHVPFVTAMPSQQQQPQQQPKQRQQQQQQQVYKYELAPAALMTTTATTSSSQVPIITHADSPAEPRQAPSPAYSIHSVPSPASFTASPKPANLPVATTAPPTPTAASSVKNKSADSEAKRAGGKLGNKNLPLLNTSSMSHTNAAVTAFNRAGSGSTPEIIDTPTLTDFISQFPIMQSSEDGNASSTTATTTIRNKNGTSVKTDTLGAAVMLSGVNDDEHDLDENDAENRQMQSPSPRGLARSLSKKIDTVHDGLEGIKDMLVSQSPDLNMDPTDLLNLFMPEGPITTDPRTPIALDDFLEGGASPFNWPTPGLSSRALPAPEEKHMNLSTPRSEVRK